MAAINRNTIIEATIVTEPVRRAISSLTRDIAKVFTETEKMGTPIYLEDISVRDGYPKETFELDLTWQGLRLKAADEMGFVYGLYEISRSLLGIHDFWFWNDQKIIPVEELEVAEEYHYQARPFAVKHRGWSIDDGVMFGNWDIGGDKDKPLEMIFEALLRQRGNQVILGTERNRMRYSQLASDMGLQIIEPVEATADLQQVGHYITMRPDAPEYIRKETEQVLSIATKDSWVIPCANIKPHVYYLDFIAKLWCYGDIDIEKHQAEYAKAYYGEENIRRITDLFKGYFDNALVYGDNRDAHAGEQFPNQIMRLLVSQYMKDPEQLAGGLEWTTESETLWEQVLWYKGLCDEAGERYSAYLTACELAAEAMTGREREFFVDTFWLQAAIYKHCYGGAAMISYSLTLAFEENYREAFYYAGLGAREYLRANQAMHAREHDKWQGFYQDEGQTDIKKSAWLAELLMGYVRNLGEGPDFTEWKKSAGSSHLTDWELFAEMEEEVAGI